MKNLFNIKFLLFISLINTFILIFSYLYFSREHFIINKLNIENYKVEAIQYKKILNSQVLYKTKDNITYKINLKPSDRYKLKHYLEENSFLFILYFENFHKKCFSMFFFDNFYSEEYSKNSCQEIKI
jgi:hypothetical protein